MNGDLTLLASAYLDGDVTSDERAAVEGDAVLLAEVERLRSVRLLLADVEPAPISRREAQLAAALDTWDRLPEAERTGARRDVTPTGVSAAAVAGAASVTAPTPLRDRRRRTSPRVLSGVAAALVLVLAGGVALQLRSGDDDVAIEDAATAEASIDRAAPSAEGDDGADAAAAADAAEGAPVADDAELDTGVANAAPPSEVGGLEQLRTPADLADFAAAAVDAPIAPADVPAATSAAADEELSPAESFLAETEFPLCLGADVVVGPAVYRDVPVVVGIDLGRDLALAYRAVDCAEIARARLP